MRRAGIEELPYFDREERTRKIQAAELGIEARTFLDSKVGQTVLQKAEHEKGLFLDELLEADPDDNKANRRIRNEIKLRELAIGWLFEVIQSGALAEGEIHDDPQPMPE